MSFYNRVVGIHRSLEPKFFAQVYDEALALDVCASSVAPDDFTNLPQGLGDTFVRTTDTIELDYLVINYRIRAANFTSPPVIPQVRVIVFQWHFNNNIDGPIANEIMLDTTAGFRSMHSARVVHTAPNITVLYDRLHHVTMRHQTTISSVEQFAGGGSVMQGDVYVKGSRIKPVHFNDDALTGTDHLYIWAFTDSANGMLLDYYSKYKYRMSGNQ